MRYSHHKPDIMTVLIILVVIGVIFSTTVRAQESLEICLDDDYRVSQCAQSRTESSSTSQNGFLYQTNARTRKNNVVSFAAAQVDQIKPALIIAQGGCAQVESLVPGATDEDAFGMPNLQIDLNRKMALDFLMNAGNNGIYLSTVYLGFKDCW
ncbi:MAG: hypothetical protein ACE5EH_05180 [Gammaproteobacteria bacterium]